VIQVTVGCLWVGAFRNPKRNGKPEWGEQGAKNFFVKISRFC
jgi:hypothetical protein